VKHEVELLTETVVCSELTVRDYKEILKCSFGDQPDKKTFITTISDVLSIVTNKPQEWVLNSSVVDIFLLLLKIKINSHGESCTIVVSKEEKKINVELGFDHIYEDIKQWFSPFLNKNIIDQKVQVTFDSPSLSMLLEEEEDEILYFIKGCKILESNNKLLKPNCLKESKMLFESLPPKLVSDIYAHYNSFAKEIFNKNLLSRYPLIGNEQKLMFSPSLDSLIWFTKLMFNEPLDGFYDNLFYLTNLGHFSTDYIERCTPGEYVYFTKKLEYTLSRQQASGETESFRNPEEEFVEGLL